MFNILLRDVISDETSCIIQRWQESEDQGSAPRVVSENILLTVPSMDGLHANPTYVCEPACVCVCVN